MIGEGYSASGLNVGVVVGYIKSGSLRRTGIALSWNSNSTLFPPFKLPNVHVKYLSWYRRPTQVGRSTAHHSVIERNLLAECEECFKLLAMQQKTGKGNSYDQPT